MGHFRRGIIVAPNHTATPAGLRDQAILEVMYGCGLRVSELCGLDPPDLDRRGASLRVRGKGNKERIVPVGRPALLAVAAYQESGRAELLGKRHAAALFLNRLGGRISRVTVWSLVKKAALAAQALPSTLRPAHCGGSVGVPH